MRVTARFYEELNSYLPEAYRKKDVSLEILDPSTVADLIASVGITYQKVDLVLVEGISVSLNYRLKENNRVSVYPVFETFDISGVTQVRQAPLRKLSFLTDDSLSDLCRSLCMMGFDCLLLKSVNLQLYRKYCHDDNRIVLTRTPEMFDAKLFDRVFGVKSNAPDLQLKEVLRRFQIMNPDSYTP